jgi:8-oxo-dGTP pyrophosphatase MutT (NUDIX family)
VSQPLIAAATVVLLRDGPAGVETLLLRRNGRLAFGAGTWVFPGGRVDTIDVDPTAPDDEERAARRAAARETAEEAGVVVVADELVPFAHWTPPEDSARRFATWFFLGEALPGEIVVDGGEIVDHVWARPIDILTRHEQGEFEFLPPTYQSLSVLSVHDAVADALAWAGAAAPVRFATHMVTTDDGVLVALWHGDAGYEARDPAMPGPRHRLVMGPRPWRYERP